MQILSLYAVFLEKPGEGGGQERGERSEVRGDYGSAPLLIPSGPEGKSL